MTDLDHKRRKSEELESGNQRSYEELQEKVPRFTMDTSDMRRELFIEHLVTWGIITEEQKLDFDIAFHEKVDKALDGAWASWREHQEQKKQPKLQVVKKAAPKLLDSRGREIGG